MKIWSRKRVFILRVVMFANRLKIFRHVCDFHLRLTETHLRFKNYSMLSEVPQIII